MARALRSLTRVRFTSFIAPLLPIVRALRQGGLQMTSAKGRPRRGHERLEIETQRKGRGKGKGNRK